MDIRDILKNFNIEKKEAEVYIAALETGTAPASAIADKAGVFRTYFYEIADKLISEGLLKQIKKGGKHYFTATSPQNLIRLQEQKLDELKRAIPQLEAIHNTAKEKPKVYYFEGRKGLDEINNDTLRHKGELVGFTTPRFLTADQKKLASDYIKKRVDTGKKVRVIGEICNEIIENKKLDKKELRETRMLPINIFHSEVELGIYANKVYVANYKSEFGMIIEDKNTADVMKQIFELIWNSGRIIE
jgi:sugar-specific transcriptional regulator TrmB